MNANVLVDYPGYVLPRHAEQFGESAMRPSPARAEVTNRGDLCAGQFGVRMRFSGTPRHNHRRGLGGSLALPSLCHHVRNIVGLAPDGEMRRVAAWRVITKMSNDGPGLKIAARKHVGGAMRQYSLAPNAVLPVSGFAEIPGERPACVGPATLVNVPPKQNIGRGAKNPAPVMPVSELHRDALDASDRNVITSRDVGFLAASTVAVSVWNLSSHCGYIVTRACDNVSTTITYAEE